MSSSPPEMLLTPDSTGSSKKARRQTAIYPNVNSSNKPHKPFSRSAAKRESVMALGSIEHLQHYFTKTGIAAKTNPLNKLNNGLVPAIGAPLLSIHNPSLSPLPQIELPPSPGIPPPPPRPSFTPFLKTYETNPDTLLPGVVDDLTAVAHIWHINQNIPNYDDDHPHDPSLLSAKSPPPSFDVLTVLKTTTRAIRSVRNYVVSLPDDSAGSIRAKFRPSSLQPIQTLQKSRTPSSSSPESDPLTLIRRSALDVLTVLRQLEESSRLPLSDDAYDAQSEHGSGGSSLGGGIPGQVSSRVASPEQEHDTTEFDGFTLMQVQGRDESVPVWEDDPSVSTFTFDDEDGEQAKKREHWDTRLVLGSGWLYRPDIRIESLVEEPAAVARYLDVVDTVLFGGTRDGKRGWTRAIKGDRARAGGKGRKSMGEPVDIGMNRNASTGILDLMKDMTVSEEPETLLGEEEEEEAEGSIDDEELPTWAKRSAFVNDDLGRAHAVLTAFLPPHLLPSLLGPSSSPTAFLQSLSSGQLLCVAYNTCVRRSRRPWGYISKDAIHDIVALQHAAEYPDVADLKDTDGSKESKDKDKAKCGWTFRRTDNLRLWAAALKLRYLLPISTPPPPKQPNALHLVSATAAGTSISPLPTPAPSPTSTVRFPSIGSSSSETPIMFDAAIVAHRDDRWEEMLQAVLLQWIKAVVEERRGER